MLADQSPEMAEESMSTGSGSTTATEPTGTRPGSGEEAGHDAGTDEGTGTPPRPSGIPAVIIAAAGLVQFVCMALSPLDGPDSAAGPLFGVALLTVPILVGATFVDSRRVRRHARRAREAGSDVATWNQPVRGVGWVLGSFVPILGLLVVAAYLGRRWETGFPIPVLGAPAEGTVSRGWRGWQAFVVLGVLLTTAAIVGALVTDDPNAADNTVAQNVAIFSYLCVMLLPVLATHFDARNVAARVDRWWLGWRLAWSAAMLAFVLNVPIAAGYLYRRRSHLAALSERRQAFEDRLSEATDRVERAEAALDAAEFDELLAVLEGVDGPLETARETAARSPGLDEYRARRLLDRVDELRSRADVGEERRAFEKRRGRAEAAVERAEAALDGDDLREGLAALGEAADAYDAALDLVEPLEADGEALRERREAVAERRAAALDRLEAERARPLAERAESGLADADAAIEDDAFDRAADRLEEAEAALEDLDDLQEAYRIEVEAPVGATEIEAARDRLRTARAAATVDADVRTAEERASDAEAALDAGRFDEAEAGFREAREAIETALDRAEAAERDPELLTERQKDLDERLRAVDEHRRRAAYEEPLERGETALSTAREAAEADTYDDALDAVERAEEAFTAAAEAAEAYEGADPETVAERRSEVERLRAEYTVAHLSARLTALPGPAAVDGDDPDAYAALAADYRTLVDDVEAAEVDRERDLAVLRDEAARGLVAARVAGLAARARSAVERFQAGDHAAARDGFEAVVEELDTVRETAATYGVEEADDDMDVLAEACSANDDAARRAVLGIDDEPTLASLPDLLDPTTSGGAAVGTVPIDRGGAPTPEDAAASGAVAEEAAAEEVSDRLQAELPDHEVLDFVGSGGNADVHRVRLADGREAALKVPTWEGTLSRDAVERFLGEAETWAKLDSHEGIVPVLDWGSRPYPWMLLEFLPASLDERLGDLAFDRRIDVLTGVCDALEYAHGRGVVHLDVKPENVLLTDRDEPRVGDWGLARVLLDRSTTTMGLTPAYSAPEQLAEEYGEVDRRTDVYQASVLAYRTLTGRLPFDYERPATLREAILNETVQPPSAVDPSLPEAVDDVLLKGLARDPAARYATAVLLRNALGALD